MQDLDTVCGRVVEIRRFVVPFEPYAPTVNRERWDLWIKTSDGSERQFIVTSRSMPARRGHRVLLAMDGRTAIGVFNLTTGGRLNFVESSPSAMFQPRDIITSVGILFASLFGATMADAAVVSLLAVPLGVLYVPVLMAMRAMTNAATRRRADRILDEIERQYRGPLPRDR